MDPICGPSTGDCFPQSCRSFNVDHATIFRNFYCVDYEKCLNFAAKKEWKSFSCKKCSKYISKTNANYLQMPKLP